MHTKTRQRQPRLAPDHADLAALTTWIGCPHCGSPVHIHAQIEQAKRDLLLGILYFLGRRPTHEQTREEVREACAEAEERLQEPLRHWPEG